MKAPEEILAVWRQFDGFPMETLTKAWLYSKEANRTQRSVETMKQHREQFSITGNCFDLAIWLLAAFEKVGVEAYPIGSEFGTEDAHAAVLAVDREGRRYLCDLGDQWLQPINIDIGGDEGRLAGFFPAAEVQLLPGEREFQIIYHRPNGKFSTQVYSAESVTMKEFIAAADYSQCHVHPNPLLEVRLPWGNETAHWEFDNWHSFLSTSRGVVEDPPLATIDEWVERIHEKTGYAKLFLKESLEYFEVLKK